MSPVRSQAYFSNNQHVKTCFNNAVSQTILAGLAHILNDDRRQQATLII